jgi:hypothetical protein
MNGEASRAQELSDLRRLAGIVITWLGVLLLLSLGLTVAFMEKWVVLGIADLSTQRILLCIVGGTLGSSISAIVSAAQRISHGWEFSQGDKYPTPEPKDKFVARMLPLFMIRPFLGAAMGMLIYAGVTGGYLIAVEETETVTFSRQGLLFFSFLGGLFAKTFIEKLRAMFDTFFGA